MIDIHKPNISKVSEGVMGKNILIYGDGGTGKTSNAVKAPDVLLIGFENGLAGISGVANVILQSWVDFQQVVKQLVLDAANTAKPLSYKTIVVDGVDRLGILAVRYISNLHGANNFSEIDGKAQFAVWDELKGEIDIQIMALRNSPYAIIWIDHSASRTKKGPTGVEFSQICPAGDARVADKIYDQCDICAYAQKQPNTVEGQEVLSTLFLRSDDAVATKTRFKEIVSFIEQWTYAKLVDAIDDAVRAESTTPVPENGAVDEKREEVKEEVSAAQPDTQANPVSPELPIAAIIDDIGRRLKTMTMNGDSTLAAYRKFLSDELKNPTFSCKKATDADRTTLEAIDDFLKKSGYAPAKI